MKYVTLRRGMFRFPVLFPDMVEHAQFSGADVVSAGFYSATKDGVQVYGKSTSLKTHNVPIKGDEELIAALLSGAESTIHLIQ